MKMKDKEQIIEIAKDRLLLKQIISTVFILLSSLGIMWIANIIIMFPTNPTIRFGYFFRLFPETLGVNLIILVVMVLIAGVNWFRFKIYKPSIKPNGEKGKEKWANDNIESLKNNPKELLKQEALVKVRIDEERPEVRGIIQHVDDDHFYVDLGINHVLALSPTGGGKSQGVYLPNIEFLSRKPPIGALNDYLQESFIINDISGELYTSTSEKLKERGYKTPLLNLNSPYYSDGINPLDLVKDAYLEAFSDRAIIKGDVSEAIMLARNFARTLTHDPSAREKNWQEGAAGLIAGVIIAHCEDLIFTKPDWITPSLVLTTVTEFNSTLMEDEESKLDWFFEEREIGNDAKTLASIVITAEGRTKSSYLSTALNALEIFADKAIAKMTSKSTIDFKSLIKSPTAIFIVIPEKIKSRWKLSSIIFEQASYVINKELASHYAGVSPRILNMFVDEVGNIPAIPSLKEDITLNRKKRIRWVLAPQDLNQFDVIYGKKEGKVIVNNCRTWVFLSTADYDTAELVSKRIGNETIVTKSVNAKDGTLDGNINQNTSGKRLMDANELMRMDLGEAVVTRVGKFAIKSTLKLAYTYMQTGTKNMDELADKIADHAYFDLTASYDYLKSDNSLRVYRPKNQYQMEKLMKSSSVTQVPPGSQPAPKKVTLNKDESADIIKTKLLHGFLSHPKYQPLHKEIAMIFTSPEFNQIMAVYLFDEHQDERMLVSDVEQLIYDKLKQPTSIKVEDAAHENEMQLLKKSIHEELMNYLTLLPEEESSLLPSIDDLKVFLEKSEVETLLADHLFSGSTSTITLKKNILKLFKAEKQEKEEQVEINITKTTDMSEASV